MAEESAGLLCSRFLFGNLGSANAADSATGIISFLTGYTTPHCNEISNFDSWFNFAFRVAASSFIASEFIDGNVRESSISGFLCGYGFGREVLIVG